MKRISILGSTGSIGVQALAVIEGLRESFPIEVVAVSAHFNIKLLEEQIRKFKPGFACVYDADAANKLRKNIRDTNTVVLDGIDGLCHLAQLDSCDIVLNSVVGMVGLKPTISAIRAKKTVALANKETLVAGGEVVMNLAAEMGVSILPVDSEHSAIFQCLQGCRDYSEIKKLILTASGGPFFGKTIAQMRNISPKDALSHPNWNMGAKITIDCATMMNKGLELIEAKWLFNMDPDNIEIIVHRESIVHSMVELKDKSVIAQMGVPDMGIPIQYALTYPKRYNSGVDSLSLTKIEKLSFYEPDYKNFKCMKAAVDAIKLGGLVPAAVNGANEEAVKMFLNGKISFTDIADLVIEAAKNQLPRNGADIKDILQADIRARELVRSLGAN